MADGTALDVAAQQLDSGTENHFGLVPAGKDFEETVDGIERSSEIGIPIANDGGLKIIDRVEHAGANGFRFAAIGLARQDADAVTVASAQLLENLQRIVGAAVVDEEEMSISGTRDPTRNAFDIQAVRFVVT